MDWIAYNYRETHNKKYYMAWDKRDGGMIRYLVNHGFYKARIIPTCKHCGSTAEHMLRIIALNLMD